MSDGDISTRLRGALAGLNEIDTLPERPFLRTYRVRLVSQKADGRVALQQVDRGETSAGPELPDPLPLPVWMGLPGASAQYTPGQEMLLAFAGAKGNEPLVFAAAPKGFPSAIPISVTLEATTEIRLFAASAGVLRVGPGVTLPVALGPPTQTVVTALAAFASSVAAVAGDPATQLTAIKAAASALGTALSGLTVAATRLEAL